MRIPAPSVQARFPLMMFEVIVGEAPRIAIPPPESSAPLFDRASPSVIVKPDSTDEAVSPDENVTTESRPWPLMVVAAAPAELVTVIALPLKLRASKYVPGATMIVSPSDAALMAPCMVG